MQSSRAVLLHEHAHLSLWDLSAWVSVHQRELIIEIPWRLTWEHLSEHPSRFVIIKFPVIVSVVLIPNPVNHLLPLWWNTLRLLAATWSFNAETQLQSDVLIFFDDAQDNLFGLTWLEVNFLAPFEVITVFNHYIFGASQVNSDCLVVFVNILENKCTTIRSQMLSACETSSDLLGWLLHCISDELWTTLLRLTKELLARLLLWLRLLMCLFFVFLIARFFNHLTTTRFTYSTTFSALPTHGHRHTHTKGADWNCSPHHDDVVFAALNVNIVVLVGLANKGQVIGLNLDELTRTFGRLITTVIEGIVAYTAVHLVNTVKRAAEIRSVIVAELLILSWCCMKLQGANKVFKTLGLGDAVQGCLFTCRHPHQYFFEFFPLLGRLIPASVDA